MLFAHLFAPSLTSCEQTNTTRHLHAQSEKKINCGWAEIAGFHEEYTASAECFLLPWKQWEVFWAWWVQNDYTVSIPHPTRWAGSSQSISKTLDAFVEEAFKHLPADPDAQICFFCCLEWFCCFFTNGKIVHDPALWCKCPWSLCLSPVAWNILTYWHASVWSHRKASSAVRNWF